MKTAAFYSRIRAAGSWRAFTFIEMLLVVAMMSVLGLMVYQALAMGLDIWQKGYRQAEHEEEISIFFEKISDDLGHLIAFSQIPFQGDQGRIAFASTVKSLSGKYSLETTYDYQIGRIEYYFDPITKKLYRYQANYSNAIRGKFKTQSVVLDSVRSVKFIYRYDHGNKEHEEYLVAESDIPSFVFIEVDFEKGLDTSRMTKPILLPIGG